jgi:hypothetical protein
MKHYRIGSQYIGAFIGGSPVNPDAVECPAPSSADALWNGNSWDSAPAEVPPIVSRAQGIRALYDAGALDSIEAAVAAAPRPTQLAWASVSEFHRDSPMIAALGGGLDLDALFIYAKTIKL